MSVNRALDWNQRINKLWYMLPKINSQSFFKKKICLVAVLDDTKLADNSLISRFDRKKEDQFPFSAGCTLFTTKYPNNKITKHSKYYYCI